MKVDGAKHPARAKASAIAANRALTETRFASRGSAGIEPQSSPFPGTKASSVQIGTMVAGKASGTESGFSFPLFSLGKNQRKWGRRRQGQVRECQGGRIATPVLRHWFAMTGLGAFRAFSGCCAQQGEKTAWLGCKKTAGKSCKKNGRETPAKP